MSGAERRASGRRSALNGVPERRAMLAVVTAGMCSPAQAAKARQRDDSWLQRVRAANESNDPDWAPEVSQPQNAREGKKKASKGSRVSKAPPPPIGSVRLSAAEARVQIASGQNGRATFSAKLKWRRSKLVYDLVPVGGPSMTGGPERRFYPAGTDGDEAFENDMRSFSDKNLGNSTCQVRRCFVAVVAFSKSFERACACGVRCADSRGG